ncbi:hypothetical protein [Fredinandcohnia onubensis]|uniref:hypothetical protein n=1 Tax=Fredinandcohnia onubensis TaxID=1571209 RepID=UPI000C0BDD5C|nr:hypothetical protein [Fredinandcohnia onubensis]
MDEYVGSQLQHIIEKYKTAMEEQKEKISQLSGKLNQKQKMIEEEVLKIASNRDLNAKERSERMIPLMEEQDKLKEIHDGINVILGFEDNV